MLKISHTTREDKYAKTIGGNEGEKLTLIDIHLTSEDSIGFYFVGMGKKMKTGHIGERTKWSTENY